MGIWGMGDGFKQGTGGSVMHPIVFICSLINKHKYENGWGDTSELLQGPAFLPRVTITCIT